MAHPTDRSIRATRVWELAERQHGVVTRAQLLDVGYSRDAIKHRIRRGRLHGRARGVYAVGRPEVSRYGEMMTAVLSAGPGAVISHETAAELWALRRRTAGPLHVSVPRPSPRSRPGTVIHRREILVPGATTRRQGIPVTSVALTLVDVAVHLAPRHLEAAVNMADSQDLLGPDELRRALDPHPGVPGVAILRELIDEASFRLTDSELERMFLRLVAQTALPKPLTQRHHDGYRVDFVWPDPGLVAETDSLRYHRTPLQQRRDAARDHAHLLGDLESVRFTHFQVAHEPEHVRRTLGRAAAKAAALRALTRLIDASGAPRRTQGVDRLARSRGGAGRAG